MLIGWGKYCNLSWQEPNPVSPLGSTLQDAPSFISGDFTEPNDCRCLFVLFLSWPEQNTSLQSLPILIAFQSSPNHLCDQVRNRLILLTAISYKFTFWKKVYFLSFKRMLLSSKYFHLNFIITRLFCNKNWGYVLKQRVIRPGIFVLPTFSS